MERYTTGSEAETVALAKKLAGRLGPGDLLAFRGGLGAGKTAFTRGLAAGLGLDDPVSSPTFSLVHEYTGGPVPLYHFDLYRIEGYDSLCSTGFYDYLEQGGILAVEWSENVDEFLPENTIFVTIRRISDDAREIILEGGAF